MITNIYLRMFLGGNAILVGPVRLLISKNRRKDNLWGHFFVWVRK